MYYYNYHPYDEQDIDFEKQKHPSNLGFSDPNEFKEVNIKKIDGKLLDNIVEYNKNLTPDEINGTTVNNILKYDNLMSLSEFDKMLMAKQYRKLYGKSEEANNNKLENYINNKFTNLSLSEIFYKFTKTMMDLIQEIPEKYEKDKLDINIFMKEDRIIYVGILCVIIALLLYFISVS